jgi:hypothetical protein
MAALSSRVSSSQAKGYLTSRTRVTSSLQVQKPGQFRPKPVKKTHKAMKTVNIDLNERSLEKKPATKDLDHGRSVTLPNNDNDDSEIRISVVSAKPAKRAAQHRQPRAFNPKASGMKGRSIGYEAPVFNSLKTQNLYTYRNNVNQNLHQRGTAAQKIKQFTTLTNKTTQLNGRSEQTSGRLRTEQGPPAVTSLNLVSQNELKTFGQKRHSTNVSPLSVRNKVGGDRTIQAFRPATATPASAVRTQMMRKLVSPQKASPARNAP